VDQYTFDTKWAVSPTQISFSLHPSTWKQITTLAEMKVLYFSTNKGYKPRSFCLRIFYSTYFDDGKYETGGSEAIWVLMDF
jgi:hypothetical protein